IPLPINTTAITITRTLLIQPLFFIHQPPTTEIYTLSLHDALPISDDRAGEAAHPAHDHHGEGAQLERESHPGVRGAVGEREENRSEEHTSELQSRSDLVCRLLLEKKKSTSAARPAR